MNTPFGHVITAMVTPFKTNGDVDYAEAVRIARYLSENGSDGILVSGTTGESPTTTHAEEYKLWETVKAAVDSHTNVIAGTGSNSTATSIESTQMAGKLGLDGAMIVVPYYNKPSQEGLYRHFKAVSDATALPLMIYNIPGRTSRNMEPETTARLVTDCSNYVALKAASGDLAQIANTRELTPSDFAIYSGDDGLTLDILKLGGCGVVSVASHIAGRDIGRMVHAYLEEKDDEAETINEKLMPLFKALFITSNPTPVKAAMEMLGFKTGALRLPMIPATEDERATVKTVMQELNIL